MNISNLIINSIKNCKPISFVKFGDGEYNCMFNPNGKNCDNDTYTDKLSKGLIQSFEFLSDKDNCYIGKWHTEECINDLNKLTNKIVKYADYHTFTIIRNFDNDIKVNIYKEIKFSKLKKIIICNYLLEKSQILLNIDHVIFVPLNNWFDTKFDEILENIIKLIDKDEPYILMTCCGMGGKVLIYELLKKFKNGFHFDLGSAIDFICTKHDSRGWRHFYNYQYLLDIFKDLIDENWNDEKYNHIYLESKKLLGVHL